MGTISDEEEDFIEILDTDDDEVAPEAAVHAVDEQQSSPSKSAREEDREEEEQEEEEEDEEGDQEPVIVSMEAPQKKKRPRKKKKKKALQGTVTAATPTAEPPESRKAPLVGVILVEREEIERDVEMHRLIRQPRYFDEEAAGEPAALSGRCFNCGRGGHRANACTFAAREKPCFLCSQFGHEARDCPARE